MRSLRWKPGALIALFLLSAAPAWSQPTYNCLPTCDPTDARFLAIANGSGLITLSQPTLDLEISVPRGTVTFTVGFFDGDARGTDPSGTPHWDQGSTATFSYTLYADPSRDHSAAIVAPLSGSPVALSTAMPDNAWIDYTVDTDPSALAPSGHYFYLLRIQLLTPVAMTNAFKIRTGGAFVGGSAIFPSPQPFSYIANVAGSADVAIVYPEFPAMSPTGYDGTFDFFFDRPVSQRDLAIWDGDFDFGKYDGSVLDTDDPDTPNAPFRPEWATPDAVPEGVATGTTGTTGSPPDDRNPAGSGIYLLRPPSIFYDLIFPDSQLFRNDNPSGNQEWEQFRISTDPFDRTQMDYHADHIPAGVYHLAIQGVDLQNLNALLLPGRTLCVSPSGVPCKPLYPYLLGDTVFADDNGNAFQDPGEPGIAGVEVDLYDENDDLLAQTHTDAGGHYSFEVDAYPYTVRIPASNHSVPTNGPLAGYTPTTPEQCQATISNDNVLTCDFGYMRPASIGDRVWADLDGNGVQDTGEPGLNGVVVNLYDSGGNLVASDTTHDNGSYTLAHVPAGTYTVRIDGTSLPAGLAPTYDLDGVATPHTAVVTVAGGQNRTDVDFGYRYSGSAGDRVWNDANGNGAQDSGEAGINGVTVQLLDSANHVIATTTTSGDGNYAFPNLAGGTYTVKIVTSSLPGGIVAETFDLDGLASANQATFTLAAGQTRTDVDFGYKANGCAIAAALDATYGPSSGGQAFWLPGIVTDLVFTPNPGSFVVNSDGTARLTGTVRSVSDPNKSFTVDVQLSGWTTTTPAGSPKKELQSSAYSENGGPVTTATWGYYTTYTGTLAGAGSYAGATITLVRTGPAFQLGAGANGKNVNYGGSGWFNWTVTHQPTSGGSLQTTGQGDINIDLTDCSKSASVGDRVWLDKDGDGLQDAGETGINSVTVKLLNSNGNAVAAAITSGDGNYTFNGLPAGTYTVSIVTSTLPAGAAPSYDLDGVATAGKATLTLAAGGSRTDVDFGYRTAGTLSLGDRVWKDANANGLQDSGEAGVNGVTVQLLNGGGTVIVITTTNSSGNYSFGGLFAGTYTVKIVTGTLGGTATGTYDLDGLASANQATVSLTASRTDVDFGYHFPVSSCDGTGTLGYWKNHSSAWPVSSITIGGVTYSKSQAISWLGTPVRGDESIALFQQLVPAELNALIGNQVSCVTATIQTADAWMSQHPVGSSVSTSSSAGQAGAALQSRLDDYNNGRLCAPHRD